MVANVCAYVVLFEGIIWLCGWDHHLCVTSTVLVVESHLPWFHLLGMMMGSLPHPLHTTAHNLVSFYFKQWHHQWLSMDFNPMIHVRIVVLSHCQCHMYMECTVYQWISWGKIILLVIVKAGMLPLVSVPTETSSLFMIATHQYTESTVYCLSLLIRLAGVVYNNYHLTDLKECRSWFPK